MSMRRVKIVREENDEPILIDKTDNGYDIMLISEKGMKILTKEGRVKEKVIYKVDNTLYKKKKEENKVNNKYNPTTKRYYRTGF